MHNERKNTRFIEIIAGLLILLTVLAILIASLLNFEYTIPNETYSEDLNFLSFSFDRQALSATAWITVACLALLLIPFYLIEFTRFQKGVHLLNSFLLLLMAFVFFRAGLREFSILEHVSSIDLDGEALENSSFLILSLIRKTILDLKIGITAFGAFASILSLSRFEPVKFPVFGSILTFISGPVIIVFTWLNPFHILYTAALALTIIGMLIIGSSLVNKGLKLK